MSATRRRLAASALLLGLACAGLAPQPGERAAPATVLLVSLDGFRHDYLDRYDATRLRRLAERGVRAERLGRAAADDLAADLRAGATLDLHAADQMLVFLALAQGESRFRARELSSHARTALWLLERFGAARFVVEADGRAVQVRVSR